MDIPATFRELCDSYKESLERKGILDRIRAELRAEMYHSLQKDPKVAVTAVRPSSRSSSNAAVQRNNGRKPNPPLEYFMINEMVQEYLFFHGYNHAASLFEVESQMRREENLGRDFIQREIGVDAGFIHHTGKTSGQVPLLYALTSRAINSKRQKVSQEYE